MKSWLIGATLVGSLCLGALADEKPGTNPKHVEAGKQTLAKLRRLPPGAVETFYFEVMRGPEETVGYAAVRLTAKGGGTDLEYEYTNDLSVVFPTRDRLVRKWTARLRPDFEPVEVEHVDTHFTADGETRRARTRAVIKDGKTVITTTVGGETKTRETAAPEPPYIYGIVCLAGLLEPVPGERFTLREFNVGYGATMDARFDVDVWEDGTATIIASMRDGSTAYQFWYNQDDVLIRWSTPAIPVMFVRVNKPRFDELAARFRVVERGRRADDE